MTNETDKFAAWAELAAGEEMNQYIPIADVAEHIGVDPHQVIRVALAIKKEAGGLKGQCLWLRGVPWFSCRLANAIEKVLAKVQAQVAGEIDATKAEIDRQGMRN